MIAQKEVIPVNKINLIRELMEEIEDEANKRFHTKFQLVCLAVIITILVFGFIYG